jgi:ring-1,2-phenylacetyl-CoA epoxidase subunit PaaD
VSASTELAGVRAAIGAVEDPEMPVTLVDLGVVRSVDVAGQSIRVVLRPTRLGCPARDEMARRIRAAAAGVAPDVPLDLQWETSPWNAADVTAQGGQALMEIGYSAPGAESISCPFCNSADVRNEGPFGGSVCKVPFSCRSCGSAFDALKSGGSADRPAERSR